VLHFFFNITPYPTKYTSGDTLISYLVMGSSYFSLSLISWIFMIVKKAVSGGTSGKKSKEGSQQDYV